MQAAAKALKAELWPAVSAGTRGNLNVSVELARIEHLGSHVLYEFAIMLNAETQVKEPVLAHRFAVRYSEARAKHFELVHASIIPANSKVFFPPKNIFVDFLNDDGAVLARGEALRRYFLQLLTDTMAAKHPGFKTVMGFDWESMAASAPAKDAPPEPQSEAQSTGKVTPSATSVPLAVAEDPPSSDAQDHSEHLKEKDDGLLLGRVRQHLTSLQATPVRCDPNSNAAREVDKLLLQLQELEKERDQAIEFGVARLLRRVTGLVLKLLWVLMPVWCAKVLTCEDYQSRWQLLATAALLVSTAWPLQFVTAFGLASAAAHVTATVGWLEFRPGTLSFLCRNILIRVCSSSLVSPKAVGIGVLGLICEYWLLGPPVLLVATAVVVARYLGFGRLLRIYAVSGFAIAVYASAYVAMGRVLRCTDDTQTKVYDSIDRFMAPFVCRQIVGLRSVFVKFGQYLGGRADVVPSRWAESLKLLQDDLPADDPAYVSKAIQQEFGRPLDSIFECFDFVALASASVAQVHRAKLKGTGRPVAVKVQHRGVAAMMRRDMVAFKRITKFCARLNLKYEAVVVILNAWEKEMTKELDFRVEASNLVTVQKNMRRAGIDVLVPHPLVDEGLVGQTCFAMEFIEGFKITDARKLAIHAVDKQALLSRLVQAYAQQLYCDGLFNADPHAGNLMVNIDATTGQCRPVLLDFGMVVTLDETTRLGYANLVHSIGQLSVSGCASAMQQVGYKNSQSDDHPDRDYDFFAFMLRPTGSRASQRADGKAFFDKRREQRKHDKQDLKAASGQVGAESDRIVDSNASQSESDKTQDRFMAEVPESLIFLFRVLGLIRGLCTTLDVRLPYVELMGGYARAALTSACCPPSARALRPLPSPTLREPRTALQRRLEDECATLCKDPSDSCLGIQVCVILRGEVLAEVAAGVCGPVDPRPVTVSTVFPLGELGLGLAALGIGIHLPPDINYQDPLERHWPAFAGSANGLRDVASVTVGHLLAHATGLAPPISLSPPTSKLLSPDIVHRLVNNPLPTTDEASESEAASSLLSRLSTSVNVGNQKLCKASYTPIAAGLVMSALAEVTTTSKQTLSEIVRSKLLAPVGATAWLGDVPAECASAGGIASVGHGYANELQRLMRSDGDNVINTRDVGGNSVARGAGNMSSLPADFTSDAAIANTEGFRNAGGQWVPAINSYSSAGSVAKAWAATLGRPGSNKQETNNKEANKSLLGQHAIDALTTPLSTDTNVLDGQRFWSAGLQIHGEGDAQIVFSRGFGGMLSACVPAQRLVVVVLVNQLTLEAAATRQLASAIYDALDVDLGCLWADGAF
eukprot:SAG31_NODE_2222_length_6154_cov_3.365483_2_plen_1320_part_00